MVFNLGCHKKMQSDKILTSEVESDQTKPLQMVSFPNIIIRIQNESKSKLAEVNFNFYGVDLAPSDFENQKTEIKNLILIHFANSDFQMQTEEKSKFKDPKLSEYLNQFLSKGTIKESEYQLVRVY